MTGAPGVPQTPPPAHEAASGSPLIWINAGEASGDMHGAGLMRAVRGFLPQARFTGMGGAAMDQAGADILHDSGLISIVGLPAIFSALPRLGKLLLDIRRELKTLRPDALVLIDCPDFNFLVARLASGLGIPVFYYISPQVWAWRSGRVEFLRRHVRRVLCILPFEKDFFAKRGLEVDFVGHPLLDELPLAELDVLPVDPGRVGILPGSRRKEVEALLPEFAAAARELLVARPDLRFDLFQAPGMEESFLARFWPADLPVSIVPPGERWRGMRRCALALAASGTVTLETGLIGTPTIVAYRLSPLSWFIASRLVEVDFVSLPNLILGGEVFPELLQDQARAGLIAAHARHWLTDPAALAGVRGRLADLRHRFGPPGAPDRAARAVLAGAGLLV